MITAKGHYKRIKKWTSLNGCTFIALDQQHLYAMLKTEHLYVSATIQGACYEYLYMAMDCYKDNILLNTRVSSNNPVGVAEADLQNNTAKSHRHRMSLNNSCVIMSFM